MAKPIVSVIIPTIGMDKSLKESINSITKQAFRDFEILIIDYKLKCDPKIIAITYKDIKVRYFKHKSDNLNSARNVGLKNAKGQYIVFMDTCDIWKPDKLQKQVDALNTNPDVGLVYCSSCLIDEYSNFLGHGPVFDYRGYLFDRLIMHNFLHNSSAVLFRKNCLNKIGLFDESSYITSNWEFFLKLSLYYKFLGIKEHLAFCRVPQNSDLNNCEETFENSGFKILNKIFQMKNINPKQLKLIHMAYAMRYNYIGKKYFQNNLYERAIGYFNEALKRDFSVCLKSDILLFYLLSCYRHHTWNKKYAPQ